VTELRSGTVTFVFTDIEGSTELLKRLGDGYAEVLAEHRRIIRDDFGPRGGQEIDTQGDAFFFCFERARDAVAAAVAAQRALEANPWPDRNTLRVRMSLHTGEPVVGEEGYVGIDVHRAARICSAGHGGQVLLSATTAALVSGALPAGVAKRELGEVRLKDLDEPERVAELVIDGLPQSFPPLRVAEAEPMDFGERLARKIEADVERRIEADVERRIEASLGLRPGPAGPTAPPGEGSSAPAKLAQLAGVGILVLVLLVLAVIALVYLVVKAF
jgi:class 3 adenylate cyclase